MQQNEKRENAAETSGHISAGVTNLTSAVPALRASSSSLRFLKSLFEEEEEDMV